MFSSDKKNSKIDPEQKELIENAQRRIRQKRRLTTHFVAFLAGSILFIVLNVVLDLGKDFHPFQIDWFVWAILLWLFFFLIHFINVMIIGRLMGKDWEEHQLNRLVEKQKQKIEKLQTKVDKKYPLPSEKTHGEQYSENKLNDPPNYLNS